MGDRISRSYSLRDTTARSLRDSSSSSRPLDLARQSVRNDTAGPSGSGSGHPRSLTTHDARLSSAGYAERQTNDTAGQGVSRSGYDRSFTTHDARRTTSAAGDYARSVMTPEEIALNKEYSRKESANRKHSRNYTITQEERNARARYKSLFDEYTRNKPGIFSHNVSSQYFGEMSPMTFRQGASVLASTMDQPQIFEMIPH